MGKAIKFPVRNSNSLALVTRALTQGWRSWSSPVLGPGHPVGGRPAQARGRRTGIKSAEALETLTGLVLDKTGPSPRASRTDLKIRRGFVRDGQYWGAPPPPWRRLLPGTPGRRSGSAPGAEASRPSGSWARNRAINSVELSRKGRQEPRRNGRPPPGPHQRRRHPPSHSDNQAPSRSGWTTVVRPKQGGRSPVGTVSDAPAGPGPWGPRTAPPCPWARPHQQPDQPTIYPLLGWQLNPSPAAICQDSAPGR